MGRVYARGGELIIARHHFHDMGADAQADGVEIVPNPLHIVMPVVVEPIWRAQANVPHFYI